MPTVLDAQVLTRRTATVHEDVGEQFDRLTGQLWDEYAEKIRMSGEFSDERQIAVTHPNLSYLPVQFSGSTIHTERRHVEQAWKKIRKTAD